MNPKRIVMIGTLAFALTIGSLTGNNVSRAGAATDILNQTDSSDSDARLSSEDDFLSALGAGSNDEVYTSLQNGLTLAEIARNNNKNADELIQLQLGEMMELLNDRLLQGQISFREYEAQAGEMKDILTRSVYGQADGERNN
ncbi:hypothetical protein [Paenibacillus pinihumi]|uniref:hypothetical protein n=1 Tax=Paenibacillus pinihumi TaxID=669462 RepID=UPI00040B2364|nr:hypothetical protein [Paenibacillus pinihumi]